LTTAEIYLNLSSEDVIREFLISGKWLNLPENLPIFQRKGVILKDILPGKG